MKKFTLLFAMVLAFATFKAAADVTVWVNTTSTSYYLYAWSDDGNLLGSWPGTQFSELSTTTYNGDTYYGTTFEGQSSVSVIFNTGNNGKQTSDISGVTGTSYFTYSGGTTYELVSGDVAETYDITIYVASDSPSSYYIYVWSGGTNYAGSWPGTNLAELPSTTVDGTTYYYAVAEDVTSVSYILNEGDGGTQTGDNTTTEDVYIIYNGGTSFEEVGISNLAADDRTVVAEKYYSISGAQVAEPTDGAKNLYIVVRSYSDGTSAATKEIR